jgi:hypothetical protein
MWTGHCDGRCGRRYRGHVHPELHRALNNEVTAHSTSLEAATIVPDHEKTVKRGHQKPTERHCHDWA